MSRNPTAFPYTTAAGTTGFGMTLRDYFAAKAMPEVYRYAIKVFDVSGYPEDWRHGVAVDAYMMADAMLEARK